MDGCVIALIRYDMGIGERSPLTRNRTMAKQFFSSRQAERPSGYYTYAYLRSKDSTTGAAGTPYYIGKGKGRRAWRVHRTSAGDWRPPANEYILILKWDLTQEEAFAHEIYMISVFGIKREGGILNNHDQGGLGSSGAKLSEEHIEAIKKANTGRVKSEEERARLSVALKGHVISEETKAKISEANTGRKCSPEAVEKRAAKRRGVPRCRKAVEQGAAKLRGRKQSQEHRQALRESTQRNSAKQHGIEYRIWRNAPQSRRSDVAKMIRNGWTIEEVSQWLETGEVRINPQLKATAAKLDVCLKIWCKLTPSQRRCVWARFGRGKRGEDLLKGLAA